MEKILRIITKISSFSLKITKQHLKHKKVKYALLLKKIHLVLPLNKCINPTNLN